MENYLIKRNNLMFLNIKVILFVFSVFLSNQAFSVELYQIAHSKKLGVEALIEQKNDGWCNKQIKIHFKTQKESFFQGDSAQNLVGKLIGIILSECPTVKEAEIGGYVTSPSNTIYRATAALSDNWTLHQQPIESVKPLVADKKPDLFNNFSNAAEPMAAEVEKMQRPQLNIVNSFAVDGWRPPLTNDLFVLDLNAKEKRIYTLDKSCSFRFTRTYRIKEEDTNTAYLSIEGVSCLDGYIHGDGSVKVLRVDGRMLREYKGFFSHGYFTGAKHLKEARVWDMPFIKRDSKKITLLLDVDEAQKIYYVGYLGGISGEAWSICAETKITALTENNQLFMHAGKIKGIVDHITQLNEKYCPRVTSFAFDARRGISETKNNKLFSISYIQKNRSGKWSYRPRYTKNFALKRIQEEKMLAEKKKREKKRLWQRAQNDYDRLKTTDFGQKLSYLYEIRKLDNPINLTAISVLTDNPSKGTILVAIDDIDGDSAIVDWPYEFVVNDISEFVTEEGWYILKGEMEVVDIKELDDFGVPKSEFIVETAVQCIQERCNEINDIEAIVKKKHSLPDWEANNITSQE